MTYRLGDSSAIEPNPLTGKVAATATVQDTQPEQGGISAELRHFDPASWTEEQPKSGVYALWLRGELQYIGASKSINARMYIHECAKRYGPTTTGYAQIIPFDRVTYLAHEPGPDMRRLERELIAYFEPPCNTQNTSRAKTPKAPDTEDDGIPDVVQQPASDKPRVAIVADEEVAALIRGRAWEPMIWQVGSYWYADAGQLARWREQRAGAASEGSRHD